MIVVRIEVWPNDGPKCVVDEIRVSNVTGAGDVADYEVQRDGERHVVIGHSRNEPHGALRLVWRALGALLGEDPSARRVP